MSALSLSRSLVSARRTGGLRLIILLACGAAATLTACKGKKSAESGTAETSEPAAGQTTAATASGARVYPDHIQTTVAYGPGWLGTYTSHPRSFSTHSYWIEGPDGVVLIDTQFLPSAGVEAVEMAQRTTGKKVVAAIILHPNPDKFNGTAELQKRGIKVLTAKQVIDHIPEVHKDRHHWFYDRYKPDYPNEAPVPESFGESTRELELAGLKLQAHVFGAGCSAAHVVVEFRDHIFVGDLVASLGHPWIELGLIEDWHKLLGELLALEPMQVHPGRGPSGGPELIDRQRHYLDKVIAYVKAENPSTETSKADKEAALERVAQRLFREHHGYGNQLFVEIGLPAVWDKLAASNTGGCCLTDR